MNALELSHIYGTRLRHFLFTKFIHYIYLLKFSVSMFHLQKLRKFLAALHAGILLVILTSGAIFMHKHHTSDGEIVIHTHPYKLSDNPIEKSHHQTDSEIHYFDVLYSGSYLSVNELPINFTVFSWVNKEYIPLTPSNLITFNSDRIYLRGPPLI